MDRYSQLLKTHAFIAFPDPREVRLLRDGPIDKVVIGFLGNDLFGLGAVAVLLSGDKKRARRLDNTFANYVPDHDSLSTIATASFAHVEIMIKDRVEEDFNPITALAKIIEKWSIGINEGVALAFLVDGLIMAELAECHKLIDSAKKE
ncbi:MAG: hypothetical protein AAB768_01635 [Patescibacteria group bacterium]